MNKQGIILAIVGVAFGFIGGFALANKINRDSTFQPTASAPGAATAPLMPGNAPPQIAAADIKDAPRGPALADVQEKLDKATKEPDNFDAQVDAAKMYGRIQNFPKAIEYLEKANKLKPDDRQTIIDLGNAYFDSNQYEQAQKWYESALAKKADDINVRTDLGLTFFLRTPRDIDRAIKEYQTSLTINPNHELTLQNLAAAQKAKGDQQGLQETLARLEKINPQNPAVTGSK